MSFVALYTKTDEQYSSLAWAALYMQQVTLDILIGCDSKVVWQDDEEEVSTDTKLVALHAIIYIIPLEWLFCVDKKTRQA